MLPKDYRLEKEEIVKIAKTGKRARKDGFEVRYWHDESLKNPKFGVIVSKKTEKFATKRNTLKRKFRAAIAKLIKEGFFKKGKYLFLIYTSTFVDMKSSEICELVKK